MYDQQKQWLTDNPAFKGWEPHGVVSLKRWADVGWVFPSGQFVPEGQYHHWAWPTRLMSVDDTLYVMAGDAVKVGREYDVC